MRQGLCTFIRQVGEPQALAQVFEIKTLIYTAVAPTFPGDGARKGGNPENLGQLNRSDPCRRKTDCKKGAWDGLGREGCVWLLIRGGGSSDPSLHAAGQWFLCQDAF